MKTTITSQAASAPLSKNDTSVLLTLFDPESAPSSIPLPTSPSPSNIHSPSPSAASTSAIQTLELAILRPLNVLSPPPCLLHTALAELSNLLTEYPTYAPAYNNRAQILRILHGDNLADACCAESSVLRDLGTAVRLASGMRMEGQAGRVLASAYTQRGWLCWRTAKQMGDDLEKVRVRARVSDLGGQQQSSCTGVTEKLTSEEVRDQKVHTRQDEDDMRRDRETDAEEKEERIELTKTQLEELASRDFFLGGKYGNEIAKSMAVGANPYARLCGNIVQEALRKERSGEGTGCGEVNAEVLAL